MLYAFKEFHQTFSSIWILLCVFDKLTNLLNNSVKNVRQLSFSLFRASHRRWITWLKGVLNVQEKVA